MRKLLLPAVLSIASAASHAATGSFDMYGPAGTPMGSDPAVNASITYPGSGSSISSPTPFSVLSGQLMT